MATSTDRDPDEAVVGIDVEEEVDEKAEKAEKKEEKKEGFDVGNFMVCCPVFSF